MAASSNEEWADSLDPAFRTHLLAQAMADEPIAEQALADAQRPQRWPMWIGGWVGVPASDPRFEHAPTSTRRTESPPMFWFGPIAEPAPGQRLVGISECDAEGNVISSYQFNPPLVVAHHDWATACACPGTSK